MDKFSREDQFVVLPENMRDEIKKSSWLSKAI